MPHAWAAVLGGVLLVPLVTWFPMLAALAPGLGLPRYEPAQGVDLWSLQTFWLAALGAVALFVGARDRWLGVMVALIGMTIFLRGALMDPTHSIMFAFGALLLIAVRETPGWAVPIIRRVLIGCAVFQGAYLIQQHLGYDLLWGPLVGGRLNATIQPLGTLGGVDASSLYVAILAPLLPFWLLPTAGWVVWQGHSVGAIAAFCVGMAWKGLRLAGTKTEGLIVVAVFGAVLVFSGIYLHKQTHVGRVAVWQFAASHWVQTDPVLGYGLGGWNQRIPVLQQREGFMPAKEVWREAHNEPLQWLVETGLVGLLLLGLWLYDHRRMWRDPAWGPPVAALASSALTFHPFHIVASALVGITLIGLATRTEAPCAAS